MILSVCGKGKLKILVSISVHSVSFWYTFIHLEHILYPLCTHSLSSVYTFSILFVYIQYPFCTHCSFCTHSLFFCANSLSFLYTFFIILVHILYPFSTHSLYFCTNSLFFCTNYLSFYYTFFILLYTFICLEHGPHFPLPYVYFHG